MIFDSKPDGMSILRKVDDMRTDLIHVTTKTIRPTAPKSSEQSAAMLQEAHGQEQLVQTYL